MSYLHINNLSTNRDAALILEFKRLLALEKLHGTSSHISWNKGNLTFFSGGASYEPFVALFEREKLIAKFTEKFGLESNPIIIYGEAYGGKMQGMSATYGPNIKFAAFEVKIDDNWLSVPRANTFVNEFGLEFVDWREVSSDLEVLNAERDRPSVQAIRNGIVEPKPREGIVLHPPFECHLNNGSRLIAKHKSELFSERVSKKDVDPTKIVELQSARAIADDFVTHERLSHVIDQLIANRENKSIDIKDTGSIIKLMVEDVLREGVEEVEDTPINRKAIGSGAAQLFKKRLQVGG